MMTRQEKKAVVAPSAEQSSLPRREQTDESLRVERDKADDRDTDRLEAVARAADEVVRIARHRADQVVQTARDGADRERHPESTALKVGAELARSQADGVVKHERSTADTALEHERTVRRHDLAERVAGERKSTDQDLTGERAHADTKHVDLLEANAQMVRATLRAQELTEEAEVAKERAERSERELRTVAEFREMFIGMLGHDLRNPLSSSSMAAASQLRRGNLDARDSELATRILRSNQRMGRMIAQLLDLTRARLGGGLIMEPKPCDLREVCRDVVEEFEASIQLDVEGDLTGSWDQDRLAEVLSNLVGNAIEYAAPETAVRVHAHADEADVVVEVSNEGEPIAADVLPYIFEPFRRANEREISVAGNLGLGLYIAHQIASSHGGTLDARSADGTTTFVMRLPRNRGPDDHPAK